MAEIGRGSDGGAVSAHGEGGVGYSGHSRPELEEIREVPVEARAAFLEYVEGHRGCSLKEAAEAVGVRRRDVKALLRTDQEFADDYATARGRGVEQIHSQMVKLAIEGVDEPLVSMGEIVGTKKVYSERLLQVMFNSMTPEGRATLGNKLIEINTGGGDVKLQQGVALADVLEVLQKANAAPELIEGEVVAEEDESVDG